MYHSLRHDKENMPQWLKEYQPHQKVDLREILSHRVLFYPGAGNDGQPIEAFNLTHTVHTYLYSDYLCNVDMIIDMFKNDKIYGYTPIDIKILNIEELMPIKIKADMCVEHKWNKTYPDKFCAMCIYEREPLFDDSHGAKRFALIYTNEDAYRVFNIVYHPNNNMPNPYVIVLQEHGMGGNYDKWGKDGLLERIAIHYNIFPKYYIVATGNTTPWNNSTPCRDGVMLGGMSQWPRKLYLNNNYPIKDQLTNLYLSI